MGAVATCVWRVREDVLVALLSQFGEPTDAYANGGQTWLRGDGPDGMAIEWRLHPVPGFAAPEGTNPHAAFGLVVRPLARGTDDATNPADGLWDGLEAYPAYEDEVPPDSLAVAVETALGIAPDAAGMVDHAAIADAWERAGCGVRRRRPPRARP